MELIAKVTSRCDMACSFCSASKLGTDELTPQEIADAAKRLRAQSIILLGGEALLMGPAYYEELLKLTDTTLDFTTNLKDFALHPERWEELFRNPRVSVCTSFNYGGTRKWDKSTPLTEERFKSIMRLFHERIGYMPQFIAVMDENNIHTWRKLIGLAKDLGTKVRLNNVMPFGRSGHYFPRSKIFKIWVKIVKEGLDAYEVNASERGTGRCPVNSTLLCKNTILVMAKKNGKIIYHDCDDLSNLSEPPLPSIEKYPVPPEETPVTSPLFPKCYACQLFRICNGCRTNRGIIKDRDSYCKGMKELEDDIVRLGWKL